MLHLVRSTAGDKPATPVGLHECERARTGEARRARAIEAGSLGLGLRAATSEADHNRASELVERMYAWRGYRAADSEAWHGHSVTLLVSEAERVLATIAVRIDGPEGLGTDGLYRSELDALRGPGVRLCEFTRLAVDRSVQSKRLLAQLFHAAMIYSRSLHSCTDVAIEVHPRHAGYYERMFDFAPFGPVRHDSRVDAPAVPLRLDLAHAERQVARSRTVKGQRELRRTLYPLFLPAAEEATVAARLARFAPLIGQCAMMAARADVA